MGLEKERLEKAKFNNQISKWNYTNNGINNNANTAKKDKKKISSFIQNNKITTIVHKIDGMNEYIIEINITKLNKKFFHRIAEFIMILDVSGSMGSYVHNLVSKIIPQGLNLLYYNDNDIIYLITFESYVHFYTMSIGELKNNSSIQGTGGTSMSHVYEKVKLVFDNNKDKKNYRILVLSDGIIDDQENTKIEAEKLKNYLDKNEDENQFFISVGSIRYGTGNQQSADTRAIASVLRLNADYNKSKYLTEVSSSDSNENISQTIYELFKDTYFETDLTLESKGLKFRVNLVEKESNKVRLNEGKNIISTSNDPKMEDIGIFENGQKVFSRDDFKNGFDFNFSNYYCLFEKKIDIIFRKAKINKVSGSKAAFQEN